MFNGRWRATTLDASALGRLQATRGSQEHEEQRGGLEGWGKPSEKPARAGWDASPVGAFRGTSFPPIDHRRAP